MSAINVSVSYVVLIFWILLLGSYWSSLNRWILPSTLVPCYRKCLILSLIKSWNWRMAKHLSVHILMGSRKCLSRRHLIQLHTLNCWNRCIKGRCPLVIFIQHARMLWAQNFNITAFTQLVCRWGNWNNHTVKLVWACSLSVISVRLKSRYFSWLLVTVSTRWVFRS